MTSDNQDFSHFSMLELFRMEVEAQASVLNQGLLELETNPGMPETLESLMRAAHSIKGAARIIDLDVGVKLAHVMEDCFTTTQLGTATLGPEQIDQLLQGVDLLIQLSRVPEVQLPSWLAEHNAAIEALILAIATLLEPTDSPNSNVPVELTPLMVPLSEAFNSSPILEAEAIATQVSALPVVTVEPMAVESVRVERPVTTASAIADPITPQPPTKAISLDTSVGQGSDSQDRVVRVSAD
ncbi:MAG TPA: Hpt domain-containing protein, partial [Candidatus Obscuribacterales bacterium]